MFDGCARVTGEAFETSPCLNLDYMRSSYHSKHTKEGYGRLDA